MLGWSYGRYLFWFCSWFVGGCVDYYYMSDGCLSVCVWIGCVGVAVGVAVGAVVAGAFGAAEGVVVGVVVGVAAAAPALADRGAQEELYWPFPGPRVRPLFWEQHEDRENDVE